MVEFTFDLVYPKASDQPRPAVLVKTLADIAPEITAVAEFQRESGQAQMWPEEVEASGVKDEFLERLCEGLSAQQLGTLRRPYSVLFLHFRVPIKESTSTLRHAEKFVYALCNERGVLVDEDGAHYCPKAIWKKRRIDSWQGQIPDVLPRIRLYGDSFIATQGLKAFGLPELKIEGAAGYSTYYRGLLVGLLAQWLVERKPKLPGHIKFDPRDLGLALARQRWEKECQGAAELPLDLELVEDGQLVAVHWTPDVESDFYRRLLGLTSRLYGPPDPEAFQAASQKARQELFLRWKPAYLKGLEKDESLFVKAPFVQGKDTEFMWLEVTSWKGKSLKGLLLEDAGLITELKAGSQVQVNEDKLLDFLLRSPRRGSGGTTDELVQAHPL